MVTHLLDVNVLIALLDRWHVFHDQAHDWFSGARQAGWATCPIIENGVVRILGHSRYPDGPGSVDGAAKVLASWLAEEDHQFWPDNISLFDATWFDAAKLGSSAQITDTYLLGLAASRGGRLATFDRRLSTQAVRAGRKVLHMIA